MATEETADAVLSAQLAGWADAKRNEKAATKARIDFEKAIIKRVEELGRELPKEGSFTVKDSKFKAVLTFKINRKVTDMAKLVALESDIPESMRPWNRVDQIKLDTNGLRWVMENEPGMARLLGDVIEEKPAKVGIKITEVEHEL